MSNAVEAWLDRDSLASNVSRGLISGIVGGLAGTLIKTTIERILPVRKPNTKSAKLKMVDDLSIKITGERISEGNEGIAEQLVNIPFGASLGATYGYAKRDDLKEDPKDIPLQLQANELIAHIAFGVTTELVRSYIARKMRD